MTTPKKNDIPSDLSVQDAMDAIHDIFKRCPDISVKVITRQDVADEFYGTTSTFPREAQPPDGARQHAFSCPMSIATGWAKRIQ